MEGEYAVRSFRVFVEGADMGVVLGKCQRTGGIKLIEQNDLFIVILPDRPYKVRRRLFDVSQLEAFRWRRSPDLHAYLQIR